MATVTTKPRDKKSEHTGSDKSSSKASSQRRLEARRRKQRAEKAGPQQPEATAEPNAKTRFPEGINWPVVGWLALVHFGALAAPFVFSWYGVALAIGLHWLTGGIGVCLGYHRLFTHRSFATYGPVRWIIAVIGGLSGEGSVIEWVANHRKHHALSDKEGDPHSPRDGAWWSHVFWLALRRNPADQDAHVARWAPDLAKDKSLVFLTYAFLPLQVIFGLSLFALGFALGGMFLGVSFVVWGMFVRLVLVLHATWLVNSASHMWGYKNYTTTDDSRNNWWVALITYGEGWHNNHHAYPRMANHGHRWWEFDVTYLTVLAMRQLGLAWDVVNYKHRNELAQDKHAAA